MTDELTFAGAPRAHLQDQADIGIVGVPVGWPYDDQAHQPSSLAPAAIRANSQRYHRFRGHYDHDFGGDILAGRNVKIVDFGDVQFEGNNHAANSAQTTATIRTILDSGAVPFVLGGDHSIPIPVLRAYDDLGPITIVQIDAHLDFRDEVHGVREGLSSNMRRASEMPWVQGIVQIGLGGIGSARPEDMADALTWGATYIPARQVHETGMKPATTPVPDGSNIYITLDIDGLDPAIAPGVLAPAFGGLTYHQVFDLIRGVANKGRIVGFDVCEVVPELDVRDLTSTLAARFVMVAIGAMAWSGQIGQPQG